MRTRIFALGRKIRATGSTLETLCARTKSRQKSEEADLKISARYGPNIQPGGPTDSASSYSCTEYDTAINTTLVPQDNLPFKPSRDVPMIHFKNASSFDKILPELFVLSTLGANDQSEPDRFAYRHSRRNAMPTPTRTNRHSQTGLTWIMPKPDNRNTTPAIRNSGPVIAQ